MTHVKNRVSRAFARIAVGITLTCCLSLFLLAIAPGGIPPASAQPAETTVEQLATFLSERAFVVMGHVSNRHSGHLDRHHQCSGAAAPPLSGVWLSVAIDSTLVGELPNSSVDLFVVAGSSYLSSSGGVGAHVIAFGTVTCDDVRNYIGGIIPIRDAKLFPLEEDGALVLRDVTGKQLQSVPALTRALSKHREAFSQSAFLQASGAEEVSVVKVVESATTTELLALQTGRGRIGTTRSTPLGGAVKILLSPAYRPPSTGETMLVPRHTEDGGVVDLRRVCHTNLIVRGAMIPAFGVSVSDFPEAVKFSDAGLIHRRAPALRK